MKRFVLAGLFLALGLLILGVATANLMSGPDKPKPPPHAAQPEPKPKGGGMSAQQGQPSLNQQQQQQQRQRQAQPFGITGPGVQQPLTTVMPAQVRPPAPADAPHVQIIQQTDEQGSRGK